MAPLHISVPAEAPTVAKSPHLLWFQLQGLRTAARMGWQGMVIALIVSINTEGKEQASIWTRLLLSFRPEKELVQPRMHFPPQLYTTIGLIKMYFICLQKSLFWALYSHKACCFLFLASFKRTDLAAYISECTRHMLQPSEHCCRNLHIMVF